MSSKNFFKRIDSKFLCHKEHLGIILDRCNLNSKINFPDSDTRFSLIESLYFDSDRVDFFMHHFSGLKKRFKVRLRRYGPNGLWAKSLPLLEIKMKLDDVTIKKRFVLGDIQTEKINKALPLDGEDFLALTSLNPDLGFDVLQEYISTLNLLINEYHIRPNLKITYKRFAFEKDSFRVTIDADVKRELVHLENHFSTLVMDREISQKSRSLVDAYECDSNLILELKHQGEIPKWCLELLDELQLKETSFSKYCWGVGTFLNAQDYSHNQDNVHSLTA